MALRIGYRVLGRRRLGPPESVLDAERGGPQPLLANDSEMRDAYWSNLYRHALQSMGSHARGLFDRRLRALACAFTCRVPAWHQPEYNAAHLSPIALANALLWK
jgi:hypothetical protein